MIISLARACTLLLGSVLLVAADAVVPSDDLGECGTNTTTEDIAKMAHDLERLRIPRQAGIREYTFNVYINVVAKDMTLEGGWIPQSQINAQMGLLNKAYTGTGISWDLVNVTRIINRNWHETVSGYTPERTMDMQNIFRKGRSADFNIFTVGFYDDWPVTGFATYPHNYIVNPKFDGAVVHFATFPGGANRIRQGGTIIHEAGHWLGLRHTFLGGCTGAGDGVDDTPPQADSNSGCPIGRDTCLGDDLPDAIHNFMDYTSDQCRSEFTPGQVDLMQRTIMAYRSDPDI